MPIGAIQNSDDGLSVRTKLNTMIAAHDAGIVKSVSSGTNITVDNTDPENPVINASGTAGDMMSGTYDPQGKAADAFARANHTGTQSADTITDGTTNKAYTATEKTKLAGIADGATANSSNAVLLARANHTGTQTASTISDFSTAADARVAAALGTSIAGLTAKATVVDADSIAVSDSAASGAGKKTTMTQLWTNYLKAKADALYQPIKTILTTLGNLANASGVLTNDGSGGLSWASTTSGPTLGTPQATTSGTTKDFTIPSGVKKITVTWSGTLSTGGVSPGIQIGDTGGIETTGYGTGGTLKGTGTTSTSTITSGGTAFQPAAGPAAGTAIDAIFELTLHDPATNTWFCFGAQSSVGSTSSVGYVSFALSKSLSQELTTVRLMGGTFSAGKVNVMYQ